VICARLGASDGVLTGPGPTASGIHLEPPAEKRLMTAAQSLGTSEIVPALSGAGEEHHGPPQLARHDFSERPGGGRAHGASRMHAHL
jgi:hypothetical protein